MSAFDNVMVFYTLCVELLLESHIECDSNGKFCLDIMTETNSLSEWNAICEVVLNDKYAVQNGRVKAFSSGDGKYHLRLPG